MKYGPTMRFYLSHGGCLIDQDSTKCIREILSGEMAIRAATKERQGLMSRVLPHCNKSLLPMGSSGRLRRLGRGLAMTHTQELYKNAEYRNMIRARRDQNAEFDADTTMEMTDNTVKSGKPYQERYRACPLCQDPTHEILEADKWQAGSREHMHLTC